MGLDSEEVQKKHPEGANLLKYFKNFFGAVIEFGEEVNIMKSEKRFPPP